MTAALRLPDKQDWTVDDLASLPSDLRYELIDGRLILPAPTPFHQMLGVELVVALRAGCPEGYTPAPDCSMQIDHRNEPRPDVVVVHDSVMMRTPAPIEKAILAVEIVSPTSLFRDMHAKMKVYAAAAVGSYWVVDPMFEHGVLLTEHRLGAGGNYEIVTSTSQVFRTDVPYPVRIDLPSLTALRSRFREAEADAR